MAILITNIVSVAICLYFEFTAFFKPTSKLPSWYKRIEPYLCLCPIPLQLAAVTVWAAIFPYGPIRYDDPDDIQHLDVFSIGSSLILILSSVVLCVIGWIAVKKIGKHPELFQKTPDTKVDNSLNKHGSTVTIATLILAICVSIWVQGDYNWFQIRYKEYNEEYSTTFAMIYGLHAAKAVDSYYFGDLPYAYEDLGMATNNYHVFVTKWHLLRLAGSLTTSILTLGAFGMTVMLILEIMNRFSSTQKYVPTYFSRIRTKICALTLPSQVLGLSCWLVIFPGYNYPAFDSNNHIYWCNASDNQDNDYCSTLSNFELKTFTPGSAVIGIAASIILCSIGAVVVWRFGRNEQLHVHHEEKEMLNKNDESSHSTAPPHV